MAALLVPAEGDDFFCWVSGMNTKQMSFWRCLLGRTGLDAYDALRNSFPEWNDALCMKRTGGVMGSNVGT